jgi:hypothetical protein
MIRKDFIAQPMVRRESRQYLADTNRFHRAVNVALVARAGEKQMQAK